jgi:hypothetical protein
LNRSGAERENGPRAAEGGDAPPRVTFDGAGFALEEPAQRSELEDHLREFFGPHASLQQLIDTCSVDDVRLDALRLSRHGPDL